MNHPKRYSILITLLLTVFTASTVHPARAIVGGQDAKAGEFPFLVALVTIADGEQFCGGSIINENWVLTAAHCFYSDDDTPVLDTFAKDVQVKAGIIDLNDPDAQVVTVKKIYDPGYDGNVDDVALVHLAKPLTLNNTTVAPVKLNGDIKFPGLVTDVMVAGWGATDPDGNVYPNMLKKITLPLAKCSSDTTADYVCAGGKNGKDTCQGDSGGPLVTVQADETAARGDVSQLVPGLHALQIGIVSYSDADKCGHIGAYTRVASYIDWINKTIADNPNK